MREKQAAGKTTLVKNLALKFGEEEWKQKISQLSKMGRMTEREAVDLLTKHNNDWDKAREVAVRIVSFVCSMWIVVCLTHNQF
jgi:hypothetical protein